MFFTVESNYACGPVATGRHIKVSLMFNEDLFASNGELNPQMMVI